MVETLMLKFIHLIMKKADIQNISHVDTSTFALKWNLACLNTEVDKLDIYKLVNVPFDLSKLSDVVKMMLLKKLYMINWFKSK